MTILVYLTTATFAALLFALVPALWLQRFIVRGFPSQKPPSPAAGARLPTRPLAHTVG